MDSQKSAFCVSVSLLAILFALVPVSLFAQQSVQPPAPPGAATQMLDRMESGLPSDSARAQTASIAASSGSVKFKSAQGLLWEDASAGRRVSQGDSIRTGRDGHAKIVFADGNEIFVKPDSTITLQKWSVDPETEEYDVVLRAVQARIKAVIEDKEHLKAFEVRTPVVVAGVRGTILYVNARPGSAEVFVERGSAFLRNLVSGKEVEVREGLSCLADRKGQVSEPVAPEPQKMQEFQKPWEPLAPPPPPDGVVAPDGTVLQPPLPPPDGTIVAPDGTVIKPPPPPLLPPPEKLLIDFVEKELTDQTQEAILDTQLSQESDKSDYITDPPPPIGDNDADGIADNIDLDDDNDYLPDNEEIAKGTQPVNKDTDNDKLTDWEEVRFRGTNPLVIDSDTDAVIDGDDAFPTDSAIMEPMTPIRTHRYALVSGASNLRAEIANLLSDNAERQRDHLMDRISDAQTHKVFRDRNGQLARLEEYVFRPSPNTVALMSLSYRTSVQLTSMYWETEFAHSLTGMSSQQIRNMPWDIYLKNAPTYASSTAPPNFPTKMSVKFERYGTPGSLQEVRIFNPPAWNSGSNAFVQSVSDSSILDNSIPNPSAWTVLLPNANPSSFQSSWAGDSATYNINVIDPVTGNRVGLYTYDSLWSVLGSNLPGFNSIGGNIVEIVVTYQASNRTWVFDYVPMRQLAWRGTPEWQEQLNW